MASVKSILNCIGVNTSGSVSILFHLFGFTRARVPPDPEPTATAQVSLLQLVRDLQGRHLHLNVIRVGFDTLSATDQATGDERLDYAIYRIRNIYRGVSLGVGRVEHFAITAAQSNGRDDLGSEDEADQLSDEWSVPNNSIDVFVVRNISDTDFVGISPVGGSCDKGDDDDGLVGGEINRAAEGFSRTFAHEVGHFLDLEHNHGSTCPTTTEGQNNLMAQTKCAISLRTSVLLTASQGTTMRGHCAVVNGCTG